jgi:GNAT superfamily N-acetyltransferase
MEVEPKGSEPSGMESSLGPMLTNLSDHELAAAVELNSAQWLRLEGQMPWVEFHEDPDVLWMFAGDSWPRNTVALARFTPATADRRIDAILSRHLAHKTACNWIVGPVSQPADLGKRLRTHGFRCMIHCAGMACDLSVVPQSGPLPAECEVREADQPPLLEPLTTERRQRRYEGRQAMMRIRPKRVWLFTAFLDGVPVGETTLCAGAGVAGIYNVGVLPKFRRQRIGTGLLQAALQKARKLGFCAAVLGASGLGQQLYARLNFREVCKLSFWKYGRMRQLQSS